MAYSTSTYPYDTVVFITDTIDGVSWQASGVLISPDEVLTASHVVYQQGQGTADDIVVTPGYNGYSGPYGSATGTYIHYFPVDDANDSITEQQSQSDYAVIHLATPFSYAGYMGLEANFSGGLVSVTGYPASAGGDQVDSTQTVVLDPDYTLLDGQALGKGSSGGPVWVETTNGPEVVGVVSSESNVSTAGYDTLITTAAFNQIEAWIAADDAPPGPAYPPVAVDASNDILFQNSDGQVALWQTGGVTIGAAGAIGSNPGSSWFAMGTGAFYSGDTADIVWQNEDGEVAIWEKQGSNLLGGAVVSSDPGSAWHIKGTGAFYGSGDSDILWQNDDGEVALWHMNGASVADGAVISSDPGPSWHIRGTGDFYGDGHTDILWQNDSGAVAIWDMSGATIVQGVVVGSNPGSTWRIVGTGDFYGNGNNDILWQNDDGSVAIWDMQGGSVAQGAVVANPGAAWHIKATGDFNGDGRTDIVWQNDNGAVTTWDMNGASIESGGSTIANPGTSWSVLGGDENMRFIYSQQINNEVLVATTAAPDEFVFTGPLLYAHTIANFNVTQDVIAFSAVSFPSFATVQAAMVQTASGALIAFGGSGSLLLSGVSASTLHAANFALT